MSDPSYSSLVADDTDEWQPGPAAKRKAPAQSSPPSKHTRGATRELSEAPSGSGSGNGTTSTGHNVTVSGSNVTIAVSGQATTPADMALSNILTEAKFLHGSHSRQISGLQKKLANVAHNLKKKEDELSDQLVAYGRLEGKNEAMKAKYEALRTGLGHTGPAGPDGPLTLVSHPRSHSCARQPQCTLARLSSLNLMHGLCLF